MSRVGSILRAFSAILRAISGPTNCVLTTRVKIDIAVKGMSKLYIEKTRRLRGGFHGRLHERIRERVRGKLRVRCSLSFRAVSVTLPGNGFERLHVRPARANFKVNIDDSAFAA